jgi:hypothetical protein
VHVAALDGNDDILSKKTADLLRFGPDLFLGKEEKMSVQLSSIHVLAQQTRRAERKRNSSNTPSSAGCFDDWSPPPRAKKQSLPPAAFGILANLLATGVFSWRLLKQFLLFKM